MADHSRSASSSSGSASAVPDLPEDTNTLRRTRNSKGSLSTSRLTALDEDADEQERSETGLSPTQSSMQRAGRPFSSSVNLAKLEEEQNPTPQSVAPPTAQMAAASCGQKHAIVLVGLPARGKTHMAKRLYRYVSFFHGTTTRFFNVGFVFCFPWVVVMEEEGVR